MTLVAILGTTISPICFLAGQSGGRGGLSMGRETVEQRAGATDKELKIAEIDVNAGMLFASLVFYFVILASPRLARGR